MLDEIIKLEQWGFHTPFISNDSMTILDQLIWFTIYDRCVE